MASILMAFGAILAGFWTIYNYKKTRRHEAAKWLKQLFDDFYSNCKYKETTRLLEYEYQTILGPLVERRITNKEIQLTSAEKEILSGLDSFLNYFEFILYLKDESHMTIKDVEALFSYWFSILSKDECGGLRRYVSLYGFERIAAYLKCTQDELMVVYGSLKSQKLNDSSGSNQVPDHIKKSINSKLQLLGSEAKVSGIMYSITENYPGLINARNSPDEISCEVYKIHDLSIFNDLDKFERYHPEPSERSKSLFIRTCRRAINPKNDVWIYEYNRDVGDATRVSNGVW